MKLNNKAEFEAIKNNGVVLVDFYADWCGPCKMLGPVLEDLAGEYEGKAKIVKVNVDETPEVAIKYGVSSIPTLLIFKDGELVNKAVGAYPKESIVELLEI